MVHTTIVTRVAAVITKPIATVRRCCSRPSTAVMKKASARDRPIVKMVGDSVRRTPSVMKMAAMVTTGITSI
jgi:hypothetical protein